MPKSKPQIQALPLRVATIREALAELHTRTLISTGFDKLVSLQCEKYEDAAEYSRRHREYWSGQRQRTIAALQSLTRLGFRTPDSWLRALNKLTPAIEARRLMIDGTARHGDKWELITHPVDVDRLKKLKESIELAMIKQTIGLSQKPISQKRRRDDALTSVQWQTGGKDELIQHFRLTRRRFDTLLDAGDIKKLKRGTYQIRLDKVQLPRVENTNSAHLRPIRSNSPQVFKKPF